ncbi:MAG: hypothetical protein EA352_07200 [Gemmatimonadales bacterium]|nr:MAG: hypothetical protein EA352_07200 [Gemmatimonadales bacterium]
MDGRPMCPRRPPLPRGSPLPANLFPAPTLFLISILVLVLAGGCSEAGSLELSTDREGQSLDSWAGVEPGVVEVRLRPDPGGQWVRWYDFDLVGARGREVTIRILDAHRATAAEAFHWERPFFSEDGGENWDRLEEARMDGATFVFTLVPGTDTVRLAQQPAYPRARWTALLHEMADHPSVLWVDSAGTSVEGRPIEVIAVADASPTDLADAPRPALWVLARQHPAETGSSFMAEGFLRWVLSSNPEAVELRKGHAIFVAGMVNPDGVVSGHFRSNAAGENLNRHWEDPDPEGAPEVLALRRAILDHHEGGHPVRVLLDLHSHPTVRQNFMYWHDVSHAEPGLVREARRLQLHLFRLDRGFSPVASRGEVPGAEGVPRGLVTSWAWEALGAQAITMESSMQDIRRPFSPTRPMTPERHEELGRNLAQALARTLHP